MGRGTRPTSDSGVLPVKWSKGSDGVLLVPLQSLAPDLEVEESNSELAQKETISWPRGISSRGHKTHLELAQALLHSELLARGRLDTAGSPTGHAPRQSSRSSPRLLAIQSGRSEWVCAADSTNLCQPPSL